LTIKYKIFTLSHGVVIIHLADNQGILQHSVYR